MRNFVGKTITRFEMSGGDTFFRSKKKGEIENSKKLVVSDLCLDICRIKQKKNDLSLSVLADIEGF